jgi:hypothetical protein
MRVSTTLSRSLYRAAEEARLEPGGANSYSSSIDRTMATSDP